jgi:hypothetical protein
MRFSSSYVSMNNRQCTYNQHCVALQYYLSLLGYSNSLIPLHSTTATVTRIYVFMYNVRNSFLTVIKFWFHLSLQSPISNFTELRKVGAAQKRTDRRTWGKRRFSSLCEHAHKTTFILTYRQLCLLKYKILLRAISENSSFQEGSSVGTTTTYDQNKSSFRNVVFCETHHQIPLILVIKKYNK